MEKTEKIAFPAAGAEAAAARCCRFDRACLRGKHEGMCTIHGFMGEKLLLIENGRNQWCDYRISLGTSQVCSCPARSRIFRQYGA